MYKNKKISVVFPCRNEEKNIPVIFQKMPSFVDEVIIVSNLSTDNSCKLAKSYGAKVIVDDRTVNGIGYGFASLSGMQAATGDIIVQADSDCTYPIEDLAKILDKLILENADFVSCDRYPLADQTKIPFMLQLGVFILTLETNLLFGVKANDILSGMFAMTKNFLEKVDIYHNKWQGDWNFCVQLKIKALVNKNVKYSNYQIVQHTRGGETKQKYWKTGISHLLYILSMRFNRDKVNRMDLIQQPINLLEKAKNF
jgi:glycosyltransferase involved in cell wall biosynthesis